MIVLKDKAGRNIKVFQADSAKKAQKLVDDGKWVVDTDKYGLMKAKAKKKAKKK